MPHKCTKCESVFPNGTEEILSGCPDCGWNRFMYVREEPTRAELKERRSSRAAEEDTGKRRALLQQIEQAHESEPGESSPFDDIASVQMVEEGTYRINVSSLMEKEEVIMSIGESGRYLVHLPSAFSRKKKGEAG